MKKQLFLLAALAISAFAFADNSTSSWDIPHATAAGVSKGTYGDLGGAEKAITLDGVIYLAQDIMRNHKNSSLDIGADQILMFKKNAGHFINKSSMTLVSLVLVVNDETLFEVSTGTAADALSAETLTATDFDVDLLDAGGAEATKTLRKATIDLAGKNFVKVAALNSGTPFVYSAVLTYQGSGGEATHVASVTLNEHAKTLAAFETLQLEVTIAPDDADDKSVTWASSDEKVATVSEAGLVTALAAGSADIVVKSVDGEKTDTCKLTVEAAKKSDFIIISAADLKDLDTVIVTMTVDSVGVPMLMDASGASGAPGPKAIVGGEIEHSIAPAVDNVTFVAHIGADGIIFVPQGHELNDSIWLYVAGSPSTNDGVRIKKVAEKDAEGARWSVDAETGYLKATYVYNEGEENEETITRYLGVSDGAYKAYKLDAKGNISSKIKDQTLKLFVKGAQIVAVESVSLDKTEAELTAGEELQLVATVKPDNALEKAVKWTSSDANIASVDENGKVTAVAEGEATITVTTVDGGKTASAKIKVKPAAIPVTGVTLDKNEAELKIGETVQLTATVAPDNASNKGVDWASADEAVATVDANGLVKAVAVGETTITVKTKDGAKTASAKIKVVSEEQGIESIVVEEAATGKILHQGTLYILRDGHLYNVQGVLVK